MVFIRYCRRKTFLAYLPPPERTTLPPKTIVGKYSYGPLAQDHPIVECVGAFCSFAVGVEAVPNHPLEYISTHDFLYGGNRVYFKDYRPPRTWESDKNKKWYFPGIGPKGIVKNERRIRIGNDVWLGRNVIIANYANIGDGVVAGAGAVITKDVPDYAIVTGAPARIIRYRFTPKEIAALKTIAWWDWSDDKIRECYDDFYMDIDVFIAKHLR